VSTTDAGPPTVVGGRYTVGDLIGRGGAADVYRARDELLGRDVAIKMFGAGGDVVAAANAEAASVPVATPEVVDPVSGESVPPHGPADDGLDAVPGAGAAGRYGRGNGSTPRPSAPPAELVGDLEEGSEARNRREVLTLAALSHPGLVTVYDVGDDHGRAYFVMQLIEGDTLAQRIRRGPLPLGDVIALGAALADSLAYVHRRGVVHRDVKPGNVLLDADGRAHLSDFGIAAVRDAAPVTAAGMVIGTASYLSPEQVRGESVSPAVDIYALGLVLIECVTGRREYPGNALEAAVARLHRRPMVPVGLPESLRTLMVAMTADDPDARPDADEVLAATRAISREVGVDAETVLSPALMAAPTGAFSPAPGVVAGPAVSIGSSAATGAYAGAAAAGETPAASRPRRRRLLVAVGIALAAVLVAGSALAFTLVRASSTAPLPPPASSVPALPAAPAAVVPTTDEAEPLRTPRVRVTTRPRARTTTAVAPPVVPTSEAPVVVPRPPAPVVPAPPVVVTTTPTGRSVPTSPTSPTSPTAEQPKLVAAP
jgi:serine/threonine protein kinase